MATKVFEVETFELQDGTEVTIKPLPINRLRKFMEEIEKLSELEKESEAVDVLFAAALIAIDRADPKLAADREKLEEILDVPTLHKIIEVAGGVKLNDPNLISGV